MNETPREKPVPLAMDLDQWRRDIQTFASATKQALDGIVSELSNQCAGKQPAPNRPLNQMLEQPIASNPSAENTTSATASAVETSVNREGRLANLKLKLAERIAKSG